MADGFLLSHHNLLVVLPPFPCLMFTCRVRSYHSTTNMAVELAQSPLDAQQGVLDDIVGSPAGSLHPLSPTGDRTAAAAAAGRESSSGSAADPAAQQHHHHHRVSFYDEVSVEGGSSSPRLAVDMQQQQQHGVGSAAAGGFDSVTNSLRTTMDGQSSDGAAAPSAAAGAGAAGSIYSSGRRAVSFSVSSGPVSHMGAPLAGPGSGRFQAADTGVSAPPGDGGGYKYSCWGEFPARGGGRGVTTSCMNSPQPTTCAFYF
jgi:hypothetical protein